MDDKLEGAQHLRMEGSKLKGVLRNKEGGWHNAELDLDQWVGNTDGKLLVSSPSSSPPFPPILSSPHLAHTTRSIPYRSPHPLITSPPLKHPCAEQTLTPPQAT